MSNPPDCKRALGRHTDESLIQRIVQPRLFVGGSDKYLNQLERGVYKVESCNRGGLDIVLCSDPRPDRLNLTSQFESQ